MQKTLFLFRLSLLTAVLMGGEMGGAAAQTMARANPKTLPEQPTAVRTRLAQINLRQLLTQLETTYQVRFNYKAALVNGVTVSSPAVADYDGHIADQLNTLLNPVQLRCRAIDARTFIIQPQASPKSADSGMRESTPAGQSLTGMSRAESAVRNSLLPDRILLGRVTDGGNSEGLPGVSVVLKGTQRGTTTDTDGRYRLIIPEGEGAATLVFSFVGYSSKEVSLGNLSTIDVQLLPDDKSLSEVVVVGYGTQKKADLTGAVATVDIQQVLTKPAADVSNMLQGRVAGVVASGSNQPGGEGYVRIRGISSFGNNAPLIIIDGVQTTSTNSLNPNDIESMSVLKDASSAAIYGARGAGGVIIITTKKGKANTTRISYDGFYGVSTVSRYPNLLNTPELADLIWKQQLGAGLTPSSTQFGRGTTPVIPDYVLAGTAGGLFEGNAAVDPSRYNFNQSGFYQIARANKEGTDWFREMTQAAPVQSHNLSASGGTERAIYSLSLGYYS